MAPLIKNVNIRATGLQEFWTNKYPNSLYLWQGAKHDRPLPQIENDPVPTHKDIIYTAEEIQRAHDYCKLFYYKSLPVLAERLNQVHGTNLSFRFWQITFGKWLYRHIAVLYEKYEYLRGLDLENCGIKLLAKEYFFTPNDHYDWVLCFSNNFGVQQLVSLYCSLFTDIHFEEVKMAFPVRPIDFCNLAPDDGGKSVEIALLGVYFSSEIYNTLYNQSHGKISNIALPAVQIKPGQNDHQSRSLISHTPEVRNFEAYFYHSLYHSMPKDFIENFKLYKEAYEKDIESRNFKHIVAEAWISQIPSAIYTGLAREKGRKFICYEHGAGNIFYKNFPTFTELEVSDTYLSVGWGETAGRFVKGGFAARDMLQYDWNSGSNKILYVSLTKSPYIYELNEAVAVNANFVRELKLTYDFTELLPAKLKENFVFRPRPKDAFYWDTEATLDLEGRNIKVERGDFRAAIHDARIIVIDHVSTGISELLLSGIPFILLNDSLTRYEDEALPIFRKLADCGVLHTTAKSAVDYLSKIYDDVESWWKSPVVQEAVRKMSHYSLAPASRVSDYLLGILDGKANNLVASKLQGGLPGALQENADNEYRRGLMYENGTGVSQSIDQALHWYAKAAEHGSVDACKRLGVIYSQGAGVSKDLLTAYVWFKISAKKGDTQVIEVEKILEELLTPEQITNGRRLSEFWLEKHGRARVS